ncbi:MAG TPA: hypothetical protein VE218_07790 [Acidobacteriaceae bacterium]|nr:hypothetical protein [Acidobacteriaceae bacterium]
MTPEELAKVSVAVADPGLIETDCNTLDGPLQSILDGSVISACGEAPLTESVTVTEPTE